MSQSHYGSIKSDEMRKMIFDFQTSQSHYGSIKSETAYCYLYVDWPLSQSHYGSIKS